MCSPDCPRTSSADQAHRELPASASQVLGLKTFATTTHPGFSPLGAGCVNQTLEGQERS